MQKVKIVLMVIAAIVLGLMIGLVGVANSTETRFENCEPGTWVGGVKWEWKDGIRGNYSGSKYVDIPEIDLRDVGSIVVDLEPGDYAITHFRPKRAGYTADGHRFFFPSAVLDFREIEVGTNTEIHYFGCD